MSLKAIEWENASPILEVELFGGCSLGGGPGSLLGGDCLCSSDGGGLVQGHSGPGHCASDSDAAKS